MKHRTNLRKVEAMKREVARKIEAAKQKAKEVN